MSFLFCPNCGPVDIENTHFVNQEETLTVRGEAITHIAPVRICDTCGESIYDEELDAPSLDEVYAIYRRRHNLIAPGEIAALRETYGLSQRGLSALLGLGEVTIHRYENGALPEEAYSHLLRLLKRPENMKEIFDERKDRLSSAARRKLENRLELLLHEHERLTEPRARRDGQAAAA
ncbi:MAG TPA: type II toxin-antitoxin system MqsA family antitoxin [Armatimonadota bacterium]|nr:type II toxin-antitoxin system MqsA family antitoxin [Armatimonadota bacterium]